MTDAMPNVDIRPDHWAIVTSALRRHVPDREVLVFGSRATWTAKDYSDLDLAIMGEDPLPLQVASALDESLGESDLPFKVDVVDWARIDVGFRSIIRRDGVVAQVPVGNAPAPAPPRGSPPQPRDSDAPGNWMSINVGQACTKIGSGATPRGGKDVYLPIGPYALIRSQNVLNDGFAHDGLAYIGEQHAFDLAGVEVLDQDVLLNITGDSVARVCQVDPHILPARVNQHVAIVRPDPTRLDPRFLRYYLVRPEMQAKLLSWAGSGGTRNALTKAMIEALDVRAPEDVSEQRAIAQILGTLDDKIEANRQMNETLEAIARALFKSWFVDFDPVRAKMKDRDTGSPKDIVDLFPDRLVDSELDYIPVGWEVKPLGDLLELAYGKALPQGKRRPGNVPVYGSNGPIGWHDEQLIDGPGIIVGRKGNPGLVRWSSTDFFPIDTTFYVVPKDNRFGLWFLFHVLRTQDLPSIASDSAVPGMNRNLAYMNRAIVPPTSVIDAFCKRAMAISTRQNGLDRESRNLAALRDALLPKLVSGEIRIPDAERALESVT